MLSGPEFLEMMRGNGVARQRALDALLPHMAMWATRQCRLLFDSPDDAMDVVQEVCIKLMEGRYTGEQPLEAWLRTVIKHQVHDLYRKHRPKAYVPLDTTDLGTDADADPWATMPSTKGGAGWHREVLGCLYKIVAVLEREGPARKGAVRAYDFLLFLIDHEGEPSGEELASFLGTSVGAATERKRTLLRDKLPPLCKTHCGDADCLHA